MGRNRKRKRVTQSLASAEMTPQIVEQPGNPITPRFDVLAPDDGSDKESCEARRPPDLVPDQVAPAEQEWSTVPVKPPNKKRKKLPKKDSPNYPSISYSSRSRLQSAIKISDLQSLVLYILANGVSPQWVSVRHFTAIRKVVVVMVPGFERRMFHNEVKADDEDRSLLEQAESRLRTETGLTATEDEDALPLNGYRPLELSKDALQEPLRPLADVFEHVWPVLSPGDGKGSQLHSPIAAMLQSPLPKAQDKKAPGAQLPREAHAWEDKPTTVRHMIASVEQLRENDFAIHPVLLETDEQKLAESCRRQKLQGTTGREWVETEVGSSDAVQSPSGGEGEPDDPTAGREVLAMDCEMCKTSDGELALTRIGVVGWDGSVVMDELVKPERPITDYLTPYSGITKAMLEPVTTTLEDVQSRLLRLLHARAVVVGHSLNADLAALWMSHPYIVDTSILYPHPRGSPLKSSLKWLAQKYLGREIQKGHGSSGHSPIEDALACLDLVKQKCKRGLSWGTREASAESIYKRIARTPIPAKFSSHPNTGSGRTGAVVDCGRPDKGLGAAATFCIGCQSDDEVVQGIKSAVNGDQGGKLVPAGGVDFVWARLRELAFVKGWWNDNGTKENSNGDEKTPTDSDHDGHGVESSVHGRDSGRVRDALTESVRRVVDIYDSLPPCTAFIVYSGSGDPRNMARLQALHQQYRREFATRKWDDLSVQWTDVEVQSLRQATKKARESIAMLVVK